MRKTILTSLSVICYLLIVHIYADAKITGPCVNCHTMHNSQNGAVMATYGADGRQWKGTGPYPALTRGDCLGCHGMGTSNKIVSIGGSEIPQVYHTDGSGDLAGGNFAYITGSKSPVTADQNSAGHNVIDLGAVYQETILTGPPGYDTPVSNTDFTCAGKRGCHGKRNPFGSSGLSALIGAHHNNVDGKCDIADENYNSYRFLRGVKGLENTVDKWQNKDANSHNEYFGATTPMSDDCFSCHAHPMDVDPANNTISGFCCTCHGDFHFLEGIGGDTASPFTRHPTDVTLPNSGEYTAYTTYSVGAPVARTTVPDIPSSTVGPLGNTDDIVMCLSCHASHATPYADILRWDYRNMVAGGGGSGGCFTCHTQKNQTP